MFEDILLATSGRLEDVPSNRIGKQRYGHYHNHPSSKGYAFTDG